MAESAPLDIVRQEDPSGDELWRMPNNDQGRHVRSMSAIRYLETVSIRATVTGGTAAGGIASYH